MKPVDARQVEKSARDAALQGRMNVLLVTFQYIQHNSSTIPNDQNTPTTTIREIMSIGHTRETRRHKSVQGRNIQFSLQQAKYIKIMQFKVGLHAPVFEGFVKTPHIPRGELHDETEASSGSPYL
ncbi:hypothetical protein F511_11972 [Dorcoceras hygrometricum]|uniref:Uncharacterized protein n=1 Tax=Dorcoceras hygrometricum TaxID=472368 RepID=A0A2Z7CQG6_9LAMI|nr:hypothetical protein F511_11972 [Dorcoceras hygrometricum]